MTWQLASILPVWLLALLAAIIIGIYTPHDEYFGWLPIVLAGAVIVAFAIQLGIKKIDGFVFRVMASITGAIVVLGVTTVILLPIA